MSFEAVIIITSLMSCNQPIQLLKRIYYQANLDFSTVLVHIVKCVRSLFVGQSTSIKN